MPEKRQVADLRTDYVEAIFEALPQKDQKDWLIWREGFRSWKRLADFPELLKSLRKVSQSSAAPLPPVAQPAERNAAALSNAVGVASISKTLMARAGASGVSGLLNAEATKLLNEWSQDAGTVNLAIMDEAEQSDRDTRYPKKFEIAIFSEQAMIRNVTVDISMRGMQVRDAIPTGLPSFFHVEINTGKSVIPVICSLVSSRDGSPSRRLRIEVNESPDLLLSALLSGN